MRSNEIDQINNVVATLTEAIDYLDQKRDQLNELFFLFEDIIHGLQAIKQVDYIQNSESIVKYTNQLIEVIGNLLSGNKDFVIVRDSFYLWKMFLTLDMGEELFREGDYSTAAKCYNSLINVDNEEYQSIAYYRLGQMSRSSDPIYAFNMFKIAFKTNNSISKLVLNNEHPSFNYIYEDISEDLEAQCPFCSQEVKPHFCAESFEGLSYNRMYNPVKVWMYCNSCEHMFSYNNPSSLSNMKFDGVNFKIMPSKLAFLPSIGENLSEIKKIASGNKLLDVGIGGGELLAVAKELLFDVEGLEIVRIQADHIANLLNIPVSACDFLKYETDKRYDVITMGDVIEHIEDPAATIRKAYDLLNDRGVLWISTPNFQSAHAQFVKFDDAMWKEAGHLHYFSYHSLKMILEEHQFQIIDYKMSKHYKGSMEVTAIKIK